MQELVGQFETVDVARELLNLINSPKTHVRQVSAVLTKDPILMKSVLRYANASVYGLRGRISDLNLAVILLGFDVLKKTVARVVIHNSLRKIVTAFSEYDTFWQHSLYVARICFVLANETKRWAPSEAFTAGLLHDIGHIAPHLEMPLLRLSIDRLETNNHVDHGILGANIARQWEIPPSIVEAIQYHHCPYHSSEARVLTALVHIADVVCTQQGSFPSVEESNISYDPRTGILAGFETETIHDIQKLYPLEKYCTHEPGIDFMTELKSTLLTAVSLLPEEERIVLALRYFDGLTFAEIGKLCGYDASVAEHHHTKALIRLKSYLFPNTNSNSSDICYDDGRRNT
ncbi:MAG: HDOD domain-containing protein [Bacteroidetes bacterium]|nr:HDOD domain-containing protein [Bacteroidota bacterium]